MRHVDRDAEFVLGTDRRTARDATPFDVRETLRAAGFWGFGWGCRRLHLDQPGAQVEITEAHARVLEVRPALFAQLISDNPLGFFILKHALTRIHDRGGSSISRRALHGSLPR
jgi:hypothetical protein